jgi:hypothetical protein
MCNFADAGGLPFAFEFSLGTAGCCMFVVMAGAVGVLILIIRQVSRSNFDRLNMMRPGSRPPPRLQQPRIVEDGFWLHGPSIRPGSVVRYRYRTGGQMRTGTHRIDPGPKGQFVYTGVQPEDIEILDVMPAEVPTLDAVDDWDAPDTPAASASSTSASPRADDDFPPDAASGADSAEQGSSGADFPAAY